MVKQLYWLYWAIIKWSYYCLFVINACVIPVNKCVFFPHKKDNMTALTEVYAELLKHRHQFWLCIGELKTSQGKWYWIWVTLTGLTSSHMGFPGGSDCKESACSAGDLGSGRSPREGNGNPLQYSCLENLRDSRAWQAVVHVVAKSRTQLSNFTQEKHWV